MSPSPSPRDLVPKAIRVGISSCLLGERVRYDGSHKKSRSLLEFFAGVVEWVPVCPEVEVGLPTPRDPIRLEGDPDDPRLIVTTTGEDITERMKGYARVRVRQLLDIGICGYVFKRNSPSCGLVAVPVHTATNALQRDGRGIFAAALAEAAPALPLEQEDRLMDLATKESFAERLVAYSEARGVS